MKLKKLTIELETWGDNKGKYIGRVSYDDPHGTMEIILAPEVADHYLRVSQAALNQFALDGIKDLNAALAGVRGNDSTK